MKTEVLSVLEPLPTSSPKPRGLKTQTCLAKKNKTRVTHALISWQFVGIVRAHPDQITTSLPRPDVRLMTALEHMCRATAAQTLWGCAHSCSGTAQDWVLLSVQMDCSVRTCE